MNSSRKTRSIIICVLIAACILLITGRIAMGDFVFGEPENLGPSVNSAYVDGIADVSSDGQELYFESDSPGGPGDLDIWVTKRRTVTDSWELAVSLGVPVNGPYSDGGPCITRDGLSLYFSSDRPGGSGGADIYMTTRATREDPWEEPVNLGPIVNGSAWDQCPSISADGLTLVFGSNREKIGTAYSALCYIYETTRPTKDDPWSEPIRLGPAVNPELGYDSDYPSISADGLSLYFRYVSSEARGLWVATRTSVSNSWNRTVDLGLRGASPRFSADGSIMYWTSRAYGGYGDADLFQASIEPVVDFNGDGIVDSADICIMVDNWGTDQPLCDIGPTPFGDGIVDVQDLIVLAEHLFKEYPPAESVEVNEDNNGGQFELERGQILVVTLESNPSTGYKWELAEQSKSILLQLGEVEFKSSDTGDPPTVGAGGWEIFRFRAVSTGQMPLLFFYHRSWEDAEFLNTFSIQVTVN